MIVLWAGIPLSTSDPKLLDNSGFYAVILFSILYFIAYQTIAAFWITLVVLVALVLIEHTRRQDPEPLYTKLAQTLILASLIAYAMRKFTEYFLPTLQARLTEQFEFLFQLLKLRETIAIIVACIILYATAANTVESLRRFEWREYGRPPNSNNILAVALHQLIYYIGNFFRILSTAFVTVLREAIAYIVKTFFSRHLLRTTLYILGTAGFCSLLVGQLIFVGPHLVHVLTNSEPFFSPTNSLLYSYAVLVAVFVLTTLEVAALTVIWLPRAASPIARRSAYKILTLASAGVVICMWISVFTAWVSNYIFQFDGKQFVTPGYFTALVAIYFLWALVLELWSGRD